MRILFLSAANSVHTIRWTNALAKRGHEVALVSIIDHKAQAGMLSDSVKVFYLPVCGMAGYYLNAPFLRKIYQERRFDVVNAHYASGYGTLARMAGLPDVLLSVWGSDVYDFPYESRWKKRILEKNLGHAAQIASTSQGMAEQTRKFLKRKKTIWITPFGVDVHKFAPASERKSSQKETVFGIVKTLSPKYGIGTVIRAFDIFCQDLPKEERERIRLKIYGEGEQREELMALTEQLRLREKVFFEGWIPNDQVPEALKGLDVFVLGSESESFGVAAVEAMACGLPIVATNVTGFREVIKDGETGFLVPVKDARAMAGHMKKLYKDRELREEMGRKGRMRVEELYSWEICVEKMLAIYRQLRCNDES